MKLLLVCSRNRIRSLTAGHHLARRPGLAARFPDELAGTRVVCLHIPDDYAYGDEELLDLIEAGVESLLEPMSSAATERRS